MNNKKYIRGSKNGLAGVLLLLMLCLFGCGKDEIVISTVSGGSPEEGTYAIVDDVSEETIFVHISGAVVNPGLYELSSGARLYDAIVLAGGFIGDADTDYANLAEVLKDGEKYIIYTTSETAALSEITGTCQDSHYTSEGLLDINLATEEEFRTLPGIGQSKATAIIKYREENGPFLLVEDLKKVSGIGDGIFSGLEEYITVR